MSEVNNDTSIDFFADGNAAPLEIDENAEATIDNLVKFSKESKDLEAKIADVQVNLAEKQSRLEKILRVIIPTIMERLGVAEYKLTDGSKVTVKEEVKCGITEENKPAAHAWLTEHDFDGIIKTAVQAEFGKGDIEKAQAALQVLLSQGYEASLNKNIHPMTLKSFVKERLEAGDALPLDVFGVFEYKQAKITLPKSRK